MSSTGLICLKLNFLLQLG